MNEESRARAQLVELLQKQNELNITTCGESWRLGVCGRTGRTINWLRCIRMEASELIDSYNWKHWKDVNAKPDLDNAKMELIDIYHFAFSYALMIECDIDDLHTHIDFNVMGDIATTNYTRHVFEAEQIIEHTSNSFHRAFKHIDNLRRLLGMSFDDVYNLYMAKNWLNEFRVENGYAEGTYRKVFEYQGSQMEDNKILMMLTDEHGLDAGKQLFEQTYHGKIA